MGGPTRREKQRKRTSKSARKKKGFLNQAKLRKLKEEGADASKAIHQLQTEPVVNVERMDPTMYARYDRTACQPRDCRYPYPQRSRTNRQRWYDDLSDVWGPNFDDEDEYNRWRDYVENQESYRRYGGPPNQTGNGSYYDGSNYGGSNYNGSNYNGSNYSGSNYNASNYRPNHSFDRTRLFADYKWRTMNNRSFGRGLFRRPPSQAVAGSSRSDNCIEISCADAVKETEKEPENEKPHNDNANDSSCNDISEEKETVKTQEDNKQHKSENFPGGLKPPVVSDLLDPCSNPEFVSSLARLEGSCVVANNVIAPSDNILSVEVDVPQPLVAPMECSSETTDFNITLDSINTTCSFLNYNKQSGTQTVKNQGVLKKADEILSEGKEPNKNLKTCESVNNRNVKQTSEKETPSIKLKSKTKTEDEGTKKVSDSVKQDSKQKSKHTHNKEDFKTSIMLSNKDIKKSNSSSKRKSIDSTDSSKRKIIDTTDTTNTCKIPKLSDTQKTDSNDNNNNINKEVGNSKRSEPREKANSEEKHSKKRKTVDDTEGNSSKHKHSQSKDLQGKIKAKKPARENRESVSEAEHKSTEKTTPKKNKKQMEVEPDNIQLDASKKIAAKRIFRRKTTEANTAEMKENQENSNAKSEVAPAKIILRRKTVESRNVVRKEERSKSVCRSNYPEFEIVDRFQRAKSEGRITRSKSQEFGLYCEALPLPIERARRINRSRSQSKNRSDTGTSELVFDKNKKHRNHSKKVLETDDDSDASSISGKSSSSEKGAAIKKRRPSQTYHIPKIIPTVPVTSTKLEDPRLKKYQKAPPQPNTEHLVNVSYNPVTTAANNQQQANKLKGAGTKEGRATVKKTTSVDRDPLGQDKKKHIVTVGEFRNKLKTMPERRPSFTNRLDFLFGNDSNDYTFNKAVKDEPIFEDQHAAPGEPTKPGSDTNNTSTGGNSKHNVPSTTCKRKTLKDDELSHNPKKGAVPWDHALRAVSNLKDERKAQQITSTNQDHKKNEPKRSASTNDGNTPTTIPLKINSKDPRKLSWERRQSVTCPPSNDHRRSSVSAQVVSISNISDIKNTEEKSSLVSEPSNDKPFQKSYLDHKMKRRDQNKPSSSLSKSTVQTITLNVANDKSAKLVLQERSATINVVSEFVQETILGLEVEVHETKTAHKLSHTKVEKLQRVLVRKTPLIEVAKTVKQKINKPNNNKKKLQRGHKKQQREESHSEEQKISKAEKPDNKNKEVEVIELLSSDDEAENPKANEIKNVESINKLMRTVFEAPTVSDTIASVIAPVAIEPDPSSRAQISTNTLYNKVPVFPVQAPQQSPASVVEPTSSNYPIQQQHNISGAGEESTNVTTSVIVPPQNNHIGLPPVATTNGGVTICNEAPTHVQPLTNNVQPAIHVVQPIHTAPTPVHVVQPICTAPPPLQQPRVVTHNDCASSFALSISFHLNLMHFVSQNFECYRRLGLSEEYLLEQLSDLIIIPKNAIRRLSKRFLFYFQTHHIQNFSCKILFRHLDYYINERHDFKIPPKVILRLLFEVATVLRDMYPMAFTDFFYGQVYEMYFNCQLHPQAQNNPVPVNQNNNLPAFQPHQHGASIQHRSGLPEQNPVILQPQSIMTFQQRVQLDAQTREYLRLCVHAEKPPQRPRQPRKQRSRTSADNVNNEKQLQNQMQQRLHHLLTINNQGCGNSTGGPLPSQAIPTPAPTSVSIPPPASVPVPPPDYPTALQMLNQQVSTFGHNMQAPNNMPAVAHHTTVRGQPNSNTLQHSDLSAIDRFVPPNVTISVSHNANGELMRGRASVSSTYVPPIAHQPSGSLHQLLTQPRHDQPQASPSFAVPNDNFRIRLPPLRPSEPPAAANTVTRFIPRPTVIESSSMLPANPIPSTTDATPVPPTTVSSTPALVPTPASTFASGDTVKQESNTNIQDVLHPSSIVPDAIIPGSSASSSGVEDLIERSISPRGFVKCEEIENEIIDVDQWFIDRMQSDVEEAIPSYEVKRELINHVPAATQLVPSNNTPEDQPITPDQVPPPRIASVDSGFSSPPRQIEHPEIMLDRICICYKKAELVCQCKMAIYCSRECQMNNWASHQDICLRTRKEFT